MEQMAEVKNTNTLGLFNDVVSTDKIINVK
jgi:hypothetical protein